MSPIDLLRELQTLDRVPRTVDESWGAAALGELWDNPDNFPVSGIPEVDALFDELIARRSGPS